MKFKLLFLLLLTFSFNTLSQKEVFIGFEKLHIMKLDENDSIVDEWITNNTIKYYSVGEKFYLKEYENDILVKDLEYEIEWSDSTSKIYIFFIKKGGNYFYLYIWKDKKMIAIEDGKTKFLVSGKYLLDE